MLCRVVLGVTSDACSLHKATVLVAVLLVSLRVMLAVLTVSTVYLRL
jgi:hypothetical protein